MKIQLTEDQFAIILDAYVMTATNTPKKTLEEQKKFLEDFDILICDLFFQRNYSRPYPDHFRNLKKMT